MTFGLTTPPTPTTFERPVLCGKCGRPFVYKKAGAGVDDGRSVVFLREVHVCVGRP